jgi:hypothetical protein
MCDHCENDWTAYHASGCLGLKQYDERACDCEWLQKKKDAEFKKEVKQLTPSTKDGLAKQMLQEWMNNQGHDRCWYYPEIFRRLCVLFDVKPEVYANLPSRSEFEQGCHRYQDEQYGIHKSD